MKWWYKKASENNVKGPVEIKIRRFKFKNFKFRVLERLKNATKEKAI